MNNNTFQKQQQEAVQRMREMNARSTFKEPPEPEPQKEKQQQNNSLLGSLNLPFLDSLKKDGDATLILGILLLLFSEKADKRLLFALLYILL